MVSALSASDKDLPELLVEAVDDDHDSTDSKFMEEIQAVHAPSGGFKSSPAREEPELGNSLDELDRYAAVDDLSGFLDGLDEDEIARFA